MDPQPLPASSAARPVVFVVDHDPRSLEAVLGDLDRRFGNDFDVRGDCSPDAAPATLEALIRTGEPVALILVDDRSADFLVRAHEMHPNAKRVLLVDRDYSSNSPAVQAMALGQADYHIVRPWSDDEMMYGAMSEYLSSWTRDQEPTFEMFRIVGVPGDARLLQVRDVMTRFSTPFGFYSVDSEAGRSLLDEAGAGAPPVPGVIRDDGPGTLHSAASHVGRALGGSGSKDTPPAGGGPGGGRP